MPTYRVTSQILQKDWNRAPVQWFAPPAFVPPNMARYDDIEAGSAAGAVFRLIAIDGVAVRPDDAVRGSALLHRWFFPKTVTAGSYVDEFLAGRRRSLSYRIDEQRRRRILSVLERSTFALGE